MKYGHCGFQCPYFVSLIPIFLRACFENGPGQGLRARRGGWRGATKENIPRGSSTEEQRSQPPRPAARPPETFSKHALRDFKLVGCMTVLTAPSISRKTPGGRTSGSAVYPAQMRRLNSRHAAATSGALRIAETTQSRVAPTRRTSSRFA